MTVNHHNGVAITETINAVLQEVFDEYRAGVAAIDDGIGDAVADLTEYVMRGGKRVRPTFAWVGWIGAGGDEYGQEARAVLRTCAALELLHASALIHDDLIDRSLTRRGFPAAHVAFAERHRAHRWSGDPEAFGAGSAILIGDLAQAWADDVIRTAELPADAHTRVHSVWDRMRTEVLYGQLLDLAAQSNGNEEIESALRVIQYKTAFYTVQRPLQIGAAIAAADPNLVAAYRAFGADIGIAFQLRDDLLGVFGDPSVTGKPSGDDLREGKRTVLLATALERADECDPSAAKFLRTRIGTDISADELGSIRAILRDTGTVDEIESTITRRTERALVELDASSTAIPAKERLATMAINATQRTC